MTLTQAEIRELSNQLKIFALFSPSCFLRLYCIWARKAGQKETTINVGFVKLADANALRMPEHFWVDKQQQMRPLHITVMYCVRVYNHSFIGLVLFVRSMQNIAILNNVGYGSLSLSLSLFDWYFTQMLIVVFYRQSGSCVRLCGY